MTKGMVFSFIGLTLSVVFGSGCTKKAAEELASGTGGSSPTATMNSGSGTFCRNISGGTLGTSLNGSSYISWLTVASGGTYTYSILAFDGSGNNYMSYSQNGNWATNGVANTPADAVQVDFTTTSSTLTMRGTTGALAPSVRTYLNSYCGFSLAAGASTATIASNGQPCTANGGFALSDFVGNNAVTKNVFQLSGSTMSWGATTGLWNPGTSGSYPSSFVNTYSNWTP